MVLNWLDYAVIALYLFGIVAFGSWFARFQKTTRDYFLTGRSVPWWAICFTIVATETSTLSFIVVTAGAEDLPEALTQQLAEGGRLVVPIGPSTAQRMTRITRRGDQFSHEQLGIFGFVPLVVGE